MSPHDPVDAALSAAFQARLDAAPEPPEALLTRALAQIGRPARDERRWWPALAGPARFSAAAVIVVVGGTIAFGTVRAVRDTNGGLGERSPAMITFEQARPENVALVRGDALTLRVDDLASAARRIVTLVRREGGTANPGPAARDGSIRFQVRVPAGRLDRTLLALSTLGAVVHHEVRAADMTVEVTRLQRQLHAAQARERDLLAAAARERDLPEALDAKRLAAARDAVAHLQARTHELDARLAEATIAILLQRAGGTVGDEPSSVPLRPTRISLAAEIRDEAHLSLPARHRLRPLAAPASERRAADPAADDA